MTPQQRESLIVENLPWAVTTIQWRARTKYPTFRLDPDDLHGMAALALVQVAERYDPAGGASFRTFASRRVMGTLDDSLRRNGYANATAAGIDDAGEPEVVADTVSVEVSVAAKYLRTARAALRPELRALVGMVYDQGNTLRLAARRLGLLVAQTEVMHGQALRLMREQL